MANSVTEGIIKSVTVTIGGATYNVVEGAPNADSESCDIVDATNMTDAKKCKLPVPQNEMGDLQFTVANEGTKPSVGVIGTITITAKRVAKSNGNENTNTFTLDGFVSSVVPKQVDTGTARYDCYEITITQTTTTVSS